MGDQRTESECGVRQSPVNERREGRGSGAFSIVINDPVVLFLLTCKRCKYSGVKCLKSLYNSWVSDVVNAAVMVSLST